MTPSERRSSLLRLLAAIDQQMTEAESLSSNPCLSDEEKQYAAAQRDFRVKSVNRIELMLAELSERD